MEEFCHQNSIVYYLRTQEEHFIYKEETLTVGFLHDIIEDCDYSLKEISNKFGEIVAKAVRVLSKEIDNYRKPDEIYYKEISENAIASVVKTADRLHNLETMEGAFLVEKKKEYIKETEDYIIPMIRVARELFPQQEKAYENIKQFLKKYVESKQDAMFGF